MKSVRQSNDRKAQQTHVARVAAYHCRQRGLLVRRRGDHYQRQFGV
jgi:hypothetical protein